MYIYDFDQIKGCPHSLVECFGHWNDSFQMRIQFINYHIIAVVSHQVKKRMTQKVSLYEVEKWGMLNDDIKFQNLKKFRKL